MVGGDIGTDTICIIVIINYQMQFHIMFTLKTQLLAQSGPPIRLKNLEQNYQLTTLELSREFILQAFNIIALGPTIRHKRLRFWRSA